MDGLEATHLPKIKVKQTASGAYVQVVLRNGALLHVGPVHRLDVWNRAKVIYIFEMCMYAQNKAEYGHISFQRQAAPDLKGVNSFPGLDFDPADWIHSEAFLDRYRKVYGQGKKTRFTLKCSNCDALILIGAPCAIAEKISQDGYIEEICVRCRSMSRLVVVPTEAE